MQVKRLSGHKLMLTILEISNPGGGSRLSGSKTQSVALKHPAMQSRSHSGASTLMRGAGLASVIAGGVKVEKILMTRRDNLISSIGEVVEILRCGIRTSLILTVYLPTQEGGC